jgi:hypothetical protein
MSKLLRRLLPGLWMIVLSAGAAPAPHPRLLWPAGGEAEVRRKIAADPLLTEVYAVTRRAADRMLDEPVVEYRKDGRRLLHRSREALSRVLHLAFLARLTGEARYVERAWREMEAAAGFRDWNPSHFLDTAEMTLALAIGYDWLYDRLTAEQRAVVAGAIADRGLGPYLREGAKHGWERGGNNWNQVCHAGMVAGALALEELDAARAEAVVTRAVAGVPHAMKVYEPDGTYPEGPSYWQYGTTFNVLLVAMLESARGTDFGLAAREGFLATGAFPMHMTGPTLAHFSFSDCRRGVGGYAPAVEWFAARAGRPEWLWFETALLRRELAEATRRGGGAVDRFFPLALLWRPAGVARRAPAELDWFGRGPNPLAVFRSSWTNAEAWYLGVKGGSPGASHGHMDSGSFVLDAKGVRWVTDLGMQDYNAMEQRGLNIWDSRPGSDRWKIFRYHNRGHSTLLVEEREQVVSSRAELVDFTSTAARRGVTVDLAATYGGQLAGARRVFTFDPPAGVVIEDQLRGDATEARRVRWAMVTPGRLVVEGPGRARLEAEGKTLRLRGDAAGPVTWREYVADPPPNDFDERNPGLRLVGFERVLPAGARESWRVTLAE